MSTDDGDGFGIFRIFRISNLDLFEFKKHLEKGKHDKQSRIL